MILASRARLRHRKGIAPDILRHFKGKRRGPNEFARDDSHKFRTASIQTAIGDTQLQENW